MRPNNLSTTQKKNSILCLWLGMCSMLSTRTKFNQAIRLLKESLFDGGASFYCSDNLITWNKNLSFLRDDRFLKILKDPMMDAIEKSIIWRTYILLYFARTALDLEGDYLECGTYKGHTAWHVLKDCSLLSKSDKRLWLYDLFEWKPGDEHSKIR